MIQSNLAILLVSGMLAGSVFATDSIASLDNAKPSRAAAISIQPETLIEKANVSPSDASITMAVLKILRQADALDVAVVSRKGQVTLIGFVPSSKDRNRIITLVENVEGVREVKTEAFAATSQNPDFDR